MRAFSNNNTRENSMKDLMIDCETLATTADAVILSIGAVKFNLETGEIDNEGFYASISVESNLAWERRIEESTLLWWLKQEAAAQQVFFEPKESLDSALQMLSDFIGGQEYRVWSNGADFDLPMIAHAYSKCGLELPWKYFNSRCYRTYKNLPQAKDVRAKTQGVKHNALADALTQAETVCAIHKKLFTSKVFA